MSNCGCSAVSHAASPQHICAQAVEPLVVGPEATGVCEAAASVVVVTEERVRAKLLLNLVVSLLAAKLELCRQARW